MVKIEEILNKDMLPYLQKIKEPSRFEMFVKRNAKNMEQNKEAFQDYSYVEPIVSDKKMIKVTTYIDVENLVYNILRTDGVDVPVMNPRDLLYYSTFLSDDRTIVDKYGIVQREYCKKVNALNALAMKKNKENEKFAAFTVNVVDYKAGYSLICVTEEGMHTRRKKYVDIAKTADDFIDDGYVDYCEGVHAVETVKLLEDVIDGVVYISNIQAIDRDMKSKRVITDDVFAKILFEEYKDGTLH